VSWHFTVDDGAVYQSLPTNEVGWHAGTREGNTTSLGIEICMNEGLDEPAANRRAALLTAVMLRQNQIPLRSGVKQHNAWSGKKCPSVLRGAANGWRDFLADVSRFHQELTPAPAMALNLSRVRRAADHHHLVEVASGRRTRRTHRAGTRTG
jgi:N-acetylmuramoyl-L-alanine amidase CwlA